MPSGEICEYLPIGMASGQPRKRRECYVGNLLINEVDHLTLRTTFRGLFFELPDFNLKYPQQPEPIVNIAAPASCKGMFCFVEFIDEVLASTACRMSGFELKGRVVRVGRPQGYVPSPVGEAIPLDVEPLRQKGRLPPGTPESIALGNIQAVNRHRELYIGNLAVGTVTEALLTELLEPTCLMLPEYKVALGPPVTKVTMASTGMYAFVQVQSPELANCLIPIFDETEFLGRRLRVGRPAALEKDNPGLPGLPLPTSLPAGIPAKAAIMDGASASVAMLL